MRERCEIFGGSFLVESRIGRGTKIRATLPRYEDEFACPPTTSKASG
jgi:signal transduction histidine kinase